MSKKTHSPLTDKELEFCALRFCPSERGPDPNNQYVILLAIKDAKALNFYIQRAFEQRTAGLDQNYIQQLLPDLVDRSRHSPEAAFRQLASLSVGPLITDEVGLLNFSKHPVESLYPDLKPLARKSSAAHRAMSKSSAQV